MPKVYLGLLAFPSSPSTSTPGTFLSSISHVHMCPLSSSRIGLMGAFPFRQNSSTNTPSRVTGDWLGKVDRLEHYDFFFFA